MRTALTSASLLVAQINAGAVSLQTFVVLVFILIVLAVALTYAKPHMEPTLYTGIIILIVLGVVGFLLFWVLGAVG